MRRRRRVVGTLFASHQIFLSRCAIFWRHTKIFAHITKICLAAAALWITERDENKIILPIILPRRGMQIQGDEEKRAIEREYAHIPILRAEQEKYFICSYELWPTTFHFNLSLRFMWCQMI
jgi:hypothetical protein